MGGAGRGVGSWGQGGGLGAMRAWMREPGDHGTRRAVGWRVGGLASPPHVPFEKYDGRMHDWRSHALLPVVKCTTGGPMNDRRPNSVPAVKYMTSGQMLVRQSNALLAVKCMTGGQMHDH